MQDSLNMAIQTYRHALDMLQKTIESKKWANLVKGKALLDQASDVLKVQLGQGVMEQYTQNDLTQLSMQHRRVMRQLNQQMDRMQEDLKCVEKGLNKAHYMSEFAESNL